MEETEALAGLIEARGNELLGDLEDDYKGKDIAYAEIRQYLYVRGMAALRALIGSWESSPGLEGAVEALTFVLLAHLENEYPGRFAKVNYPKARE
jgi:hypothetical protein